MAMARTTPDWSPESEEDYEVASTELKKRFASGVGVVGMRAPVATPGRLLFTTSGPMSTAI